MEANLDKAESTLADAKHAHEEGDTAKSTAEGLQRKIQILEEELDTAEKNLKETVEKFVFHLHFDFVSYFQPNLMGLLIARSLLCFVGYDRLTSKRSILSDSYTALSKNVMLWSRNTRCGFHHEHLC